MDRPSALKAIDNCPRCASRRLVAGRMWASEMGPTFKPLAERFSWSRMGVALGNSWYGCVECGFLFGEVDPEELRQQISLFAKAEVRQWLNEGADHPL
jgi:hypothetical protein